VGATTPSLKGSPGLDIGAAGPQALHTVPRLCSHSHTTQRLRWTPDWSATSSLLNTTVPATCCSDNAGCVRVRAAPLLRDQASVTPCMAALWLSQQVMCRVLPPAWTVTAPGVAMASRAWVQAKDTPPFCCDSCQRSSCTTLPSSPTTPFMQHFHSATPALTGAASGGRSRPGPRWT
jgi:hypothetical protein